MKRLMTVFVLIAVLLINSANIFAATAGAISTDRFGYTGTVVRYGSLDDAKTNSNPIDTITIGNRDLSLYIVNNFETYDDNYNIIMGSWWYTTSDNTNGYPKDDPQGNRYYSGWGNTRGNTGVGFMQLYDVNGDTVSSISMAFDGFNGSYWTQFKLNISGTNAGSADYSRFSVYDNVNDGGIWHSYNLQLTADGLKGTANAGIIEALNHPTNVSGSFTGLFELTEQQTSPNNIGFYSINLTLDMTNWAFEQGDEALNGNFYNSYFAVIPEPATLVLLGLGGLVLRKVRA
ncbi:MAG TPA: PEP-CTERM sorting domain-containing protein [Anaerohalosphaeraceae bacterium]|nr:PEP-CTERM sorting domain-containing protein [Anaerohalosphaeraceae bacterium]